jgi:parallel beta-helix repeat protein
MIQIAQAHIDMPVGLDALGEEIVAKSFRGLLCVAIALSFVSIVFALPGGAEAYSSHDPITIIGNKGFTAANGVTEGSGSETDPYVIQGMEIVASTSPGIYISSTDAYFVIRGVLVWGTSIDPDGSWGITLEGVKNAVLDSVDVWGCFAGISIQKSTDVVVEKCVVHDNRYGVRLVSSIDVTVRENYLFMNAIYGIGSIYSSRCSVVGNQCTDNRVGLALGGSKNIVVDDNVFLGDGILIEGKKRADFDSHEITTSNLVGGLPVYYYVGERGLYLDGALAGQIILVGCGNVNMKTMTFANAAVGVEAAFSEGVYMEYCTFEGNYEGVFAFESSFVSMEACTFTGNYYGAVFDSSDLLTVQESQFFGNDMCVVAHESADILVGTSTMVGNRVGLFLFPCSSVTVSGCHISAGELGILMYYCNRAWVYQNEISLNHNEIGFGVGIEVYRGAKIVIEQNNFIGNDHHVLLYERPDITWDNGWSLGNYWSGYDGIDGDGDGIGDTPYVIDSDNQDNFPKMTPYPI